MASKTFLEQYRDAIESGEIIAGRWIREAVGNLVRDMGDPRFTYDTREAHRRFDFQQRFCLQSHDPYYGKPIQLTLWQKAFWEALYSFRWADTGKRRFTEALLEIARKNGKSTCFAADAVTDLFIGPGGQSICCASNDDRQARIIFREIVGMRDRLDPRREITGQNLVEVRNHRRNITIFRLSSRTQNKDGFNMNKVYLDESHDISEDNGQSEIAEACWRGMSSKEQPLFLNCTTQGFNRGCYLDRRLEEAKKVISGEIDKPSLLAFLYEQDSEAEIWQDEGSWEKSNPSLRYGIKKIDILRQSVEDARHDAAKRVHTLCKDFNLAQNTAAAWLNLEDYSYTQEPWTLEDFRGAYCLAGVDLAETTDLTAAKLLFIRPDGTTKYIHSHYWIPASKLEKTPDATAGAQYQEWAKQGLLTITDGNDTDLTLVADWLFNLKKQWGIRVVRCGYDVRFSRDFLARCEEYGIETEIIQQHPASMSGAIKLLEADLKSRVLNYGNNPMDAWCFGNAALQVDNLGRAMLVKVNGQPARRIDGAITAAIVYAVYMRFRSEFMRYIK